MNLDRRDLLSLLAAAGSAPILAPGTLLAQTREHDRRPPVGEPWPPMADARTISKDGTSIFFRHGGSGPVNVIFIHGWSCHHRFFGPQFSPVCARYRSFALDLAGHGDSGARQHHSVRSFADDVLAVAAESDGPIVLVAHSAGGRVACELSRHLGERLCGIVGIDALQNLGLPAPGDTRIAAALEALRADFTGSIERSVAQLLPPGTTPDLTAWVCAQMASTDPLQAIAATEAFARSNSARAVRDFSRPVVALNSDGVPTNQETIRSILPQFEAHILSGQGHFPHLFAPESFNQLLLSTLQRVIGESASTASVRATIASERSKL